jgi:hypothetical protein
MAQGSNTLRSTVHKVFAFAVVLCLGLMLIPNACAQVLYGSLTGTVTDPTGAVIPNASLVLTNQGTAEARTVVTNAQGEYSALNLAPGTYMVTVARSGNFAGFTQKNVALNANQQLRVDVTLQPSSVSTEVTVNTAPPLLQTETAEVNHNISQAQVAELPLTSTQGRNFQALYTLVPGAAAVSEQNSTASNPSRAISANVNGTGYNGNTTRIDGAVNTYGWLPYIIAYVPPADSIQSVNLVTNAFNAEQGMAGGASINVTIKTGTNQFHGSLWEYNQLFNTNARPYVSTVQAVKEHLQSVRFLHRRPCLHPEDFNRQKETLLLPGLRAHHAASIDHRPTDSADHRHVGRQLQCGHLYYRALRSSAGRRGSISAGGFSPNLHVGVSGYRKCHSCQPSIEGRLHNASAPATHLEHDPYTVRSSPCRWVDQRL